MKGDSGLLSSAHVFIARYLWQRKLTFVFDRRSIRSSDDAEASAIGDTQAAVITGLRVEDVNKGVSYEDGVSVVLAGATVSMNFLLIVSLRSAGC